MTTTKPDEGRRVLRNVASFGTFLISPLTLWMMVRALGTGGYGRWWWSFVILEAAATLGMLASDLYVRREVSRLTHDGADADAVSSVVGTSLAIATVTGGVFGIGLLAASGAIIEARNEPELEPFLRLLAFQPLLWNLATVLAAALQSRNVLTSVAVVRGLVLPLIAVGALYVSWSGDHSVTFAVATMLAVSILSVVALVVIYARELPLGATLAHMLRPRHLGPALRYGLGLLLPIALFSLGGKLDLYILGDHVEPALVGIYAGCLQIASGLPSTRALLDPIIQTQVGALFHSRDELSASLQRLTRLCVFALAPGFVLLVAIGEPVLAMLLGTEVAVASTPLLILTISQLIASLAVASWVVPMMLRGRVLAAVAAATLVVKLVLLLVLVPRYGVLGAAIATAAGTVISMQGQALVGARVVGHQPYHFDLVPVLLVIGAIAAAGRLLFGALGSLGDLQAAAIAGGAAIGALLGALAVLLRRDERDSVRRLLGLQ